RFQIFDGSSTAPNDLLYFSQAVSALAQAQGHHPLRPGDRVSSLSPVQREPRRDENSPLRSAGPPPPPNAQPPPPLQGRFTTRTRISVADRPWTILFATGPGFELTSSSDLVPLTLLGGLLVSVLLFGMTSFQVRARVTAERNAAELRR